MAVGRKVNTDKLDLDKGGIAHDRAGLKVGDDLRCEVDEIARRCAKANHTSTHLLQSALKQVVDGEITQAGSLVDFERLRFDFNCPRPVSPEEIAKIEGLINGWVADAIPVETETMVTSTAVTTISTIDQPSTLSNCIFSLDHRQ